MSSCFEIDFFNSFNTLVSVFTSFNAFKTRLSFLKVFSSLSAFAFPCAVLSSLTSTSSFFLGSSFLSSIFLSSDFPGSAGPTGPAGPEGTEGGFIEGESACFSKSFTALARFVFANAISYQLAASLSRTALAAFIFSSSTLAFLFFSLAFKDSASCTSFLSSVLSGLISSSFASFNILISAIAAKVSAGFPSVFKALIFTFVTLLSAVNVTPFQPDAANSEVFTVL